MDGRRIWKLLRTVCWGLCKACKIQVGLRNNFRLAGWDLGSPCVQAYHVILLNSRSLYPEFENELRKSACLSSFNGISRFRDVSQLLPRSSSMGYQGLVIKRVGFK